METSPFKCHYHDWEHTIDPRAKIAWKACYELETEHEELHEIAWQSLAEMGPTARFKTDCGFCMFLANPKEFVPSYPPDKIPHMKILEKIGQ